ncbi:MAG: hypothetical protein RL272_46 [Candidatus Parcubacteria bacterium]|jgi:ribonuclease J
MRQAPHEPVKNVRPSSRTEILTGPQQRVAPPGTPPLKVYALGGLEEIGRNCTVLECGDDIIIVDVGLMFPEEGMPGIDYIIPNITTFRGREKNIRGIVVTHGHMDHIGGIPLTISRLGFPTIYTAPLTAGIIRKRQEEFGNLNNLKIQLINAESKIQLGTHFVFEPFHVNHNISDAFGAAFHTPYGTILITGDFKFDFSPVNDEPADLTHIAMFGARGTLALFSDSTNAESPGHQISEKKVSEEMERIFQQHKGRIIIGTFSSLLTRIQQIIWLCEKYGRRLMIEGRSMNANVELAHSMGYMHVKPGTIAEEHEFGRIPDEKLVVVCTGAQGEKNAVLMRIANNEHRRLKIQPGDGLVFSSSVIPGNERTVQSLKDTLVRQGAKIYHYQNLDVHAGGHAKQEDLKLMMRLTKPKYLIPIHGNRFLLESHANLGEEAGIPRQNIFVADNGQVMQWTNEGAQLTKERVPTDYVMVDGLGVGDVSDVVLRDRVALAEDGIFVVIATIDKKTGDLVGSPDIISRGFVYMRENKELIERSRTFIKKLLKDTDKRSPAFEDYLKNKIRNDVGAFLFRATERRPMVLPVIIEV